MELELPTVAEYMEHAHGLRGQADEVYRYMNFDQIEEYAG